MRVAGVVRTVAHMTKKNRLSRKLAAVAAAGTLAVGAYSYGVITSPGPTRGAGFSSSPGDKLVHARKAGGTNPLEYITYPPR